MDRASFPPALSDFVSSTESISTSGNPSKGECMDANLEEVNKESKVWQHGLMIALDWLRIFRNLGKLTKASVITKMIYFVFHGNYFYAGKCTCMLLMYSNFLLSYSGKIIFLPITSDV